jgi:hypothetical protein
MALRIAAILAAISLGGQAQAWEVGHLKAPGPLLRLRFNVPGCYPSGSAMGARGEVVTFSRAGTKACGAATCQANEFCVGAGGIEVDTGERPTVPLPLISGDWCFGADATTARASVLMTSGFGHVLTVGSFAAANTAALFASTTYVSHDTADGAAARKQTSITSGWGATHRIMACNASGTVTLYRDGASVGGAPTGAGTGVVTPSGLLYIGNNPGNTAPFGGSLKNVVICKTANPAKCG